MIEHDDDKIIPPYVSWKTFVGFVEDCKANGVPGRIDASIMKACPARRVAILRER